MKRWLLTVTAVYLAACSSPAEEGDEPKAGDPGMYSRNLPDGTPVATHIREDGTFLTVRGKTMSVGTVETNGNQTCFQTSGSDDEPQCWTNGPVRPGGTFETTGPDGEMVIVTYSAELAPEGTVMTPGTYDVGNEETVYGRTEIRDDGTYIDFANGEVVGGGRWVIRGERACFDPDGDEDHQKERCWINGPADEDGRFLTTREDGSEAYFVTPVEE